jgi:DNA-binding CsgD family transcriptional regulator
MWLDAFAMVDLPGLIANEGALLGAPAIQQVQGLPPLSRAFKAVMDTAPTSVLVIDTSGNCVYVNSATEIMLGCDAPTLLRKNVLEVISDDGRWLQDQFESLHADGTWSGCLAFKGADDHRVTIAVNAFTFGGRDSRKAPYACLLLTFCSVAVPSGREEAPASPHGRLTRRERCVLQLLAEGFADKEIALLLAVSVWTINKAVGSIISKLGAASRTGACILALRSHIIV